MVQQYQANSEVGTVRHTKNQQFDRNVGFYGTGPAAQQAVVALTNNTGVIGNDVVENIPQLVVVPGVLADTAERAETNTVLTALENDIADLTDKLNEMRTALANYGLLT